MNRPATYTLAATAILAHAFLLAGCSESERGASASTVSPVNSTVTPLGAGNLAIASGDGQSGPPGATLSLPLVVRVSDASGNPANAVTVTFSVATGGGTLSATSVPTDPTGAAVTSLTLGQLGPQSVVASAPGMTSVTFAAISTSTSALAFQIVLDSGDNQSGQVDTQLPDPLVVLVGDSSGNPVPGVDVDFTIASGGGTILKPRVVTDAQGRAGTSLVLPTVMGTVNVTANVAGLAGSPILFTTTATAGKATTLVISGGKGQLAQVASPLLRPLEVEVQDANGNPVPNFMVTFTPTPGSGDTLSATAVPTNAAGRAETLLTLGTVAGPHLVTALASGLTGSPTRFIVAALPGPATGIVVDGGDAQSGPAGQTLPSPPRVKAVDQYKNGALGVSIAWDVIGGGGSVSKTSGRTGLRGTSAVEWTLGTKEGPNTLRASAGSLGSVTFKAYGLAAKPKSTITAASNTQGNVSATGSSQTTTYESGDVQVKDATQTTSSSSNGDTKPTTK